MDQEKLNRFVEKIIYRKKMADPNSELLNTLNNIDFSDQTYDDVIYWIQTGQVPHDLNQRQFERWVEKFRDFDLVGNKLYYQGSDLMLEVIPKSRVQEILKRSYDDLEMSVGNGIYKFYRQICAKYIGIKMTDVKDFLPKQQFYQLAKHTTHKINKPILVSEKNERWGIDLIDMGRYINSNNGYHYILTCIDYFSKFAFAQPIKLRESRVVANAMDLILDTAKAKPKIIQKDNGTEFQGDLNIWMKDHGIKFINTLSYTPQSNGLVENFNKQLRKKLREISIRTKSLNWVDHLQVAVDNKNATINSTTKYTPNQLYLNAEPNEAIQFRVKHRILEKAAKILSSTTEFEVGDFVRIKMTSLQSELREMIKSKNGKWIIVGYSPEIYQIRAILKPDAEGYENKRYVLDYLNGDPLVTQLKLNDPNANRKDKRFFASELLKVDKLEPDHLTRAQANKLNIIKAQPNTTISKVTYTDQIPKAKKITPQIDQIIRKSGRTPKPIDKLNI